MVLRVIADDLDMEDVIWTDECSVQLESHRKTTYHKQREPSRMVSSPKHPPKVHVWAGISAKGATSIVIFTRILTATRYTDILEAALIPFIEEHYPEHHRSSKTMILSIPACGHRTFLKKMASTGGEHHPQVQT